ncbi:hypothetical protein CAOG_02642 [Capsaspora owczarzaki ATCC 30864]|nr:hypothetical protein CAOG_02642 [Capsaspora owczarzaki ATCC 30864]|eukprot:XP_004349392.1 hypothetical protein CAOG_02642 [Capsaspora owczarzaki ATCC 30864]
MTKRRIDDSEDSDASFGQDDNDRSKDATPQRASKRPRAQSKALVESDSDSEPERSRSRSRKGASLDDDEDDEDDEFGGKSASSRFGGKSTAPSLKPATSSASSTGSRPKAAGLGLSSVFDFDDEIGNDDRAAKPKARATPTKTPTKTPSKPTTPTPAAKVERTPSQINKPGLSPSAQALRLSSATAATLQRKPTREVDAEKEDATPRMDSPAKPVSSRRLVTETTTPASLASVVVLDDSEADSVAPMNIVAPKTKSIAAATPSKTVAALTKTVSLEPEAPKSATKPAIAAPALAHASSETATPKQPAAKKTPIVPILAPSSDETREQQTESKRLRERAAWLKMFSSRKTNLDGIEVPKLPAVLRDCHGADIVRKGGARKERYLISFPGQLQGLTSSGTPTIGSLAKLNSPNPVMYLDFPEGRLKLFGTLVFTNSKFVALQAKKQAIQCEDVFDKVVTFSEATWIGHLQDNPNEDPLPLPASLIGLASAAPPSVSASRSHSASAGVDIRDFFRGTSAAQPTGMPDLSGDTPPSSQTLGRRAVRRPRYNPDFGDDSDANGSDRDDGEASADDEFVASQSSTRPRRSAAARAAVVESSDESDNAEDDNPDNEPEHTANPEEEDESESDAAPMDVDEDEDDD